VLERIVRQFLYYPTAIDPEVPPPPYVHGASEIWIATPGGGRVHALHWPAPEGRPTILFFHGNAQTVFEWALITEELEPLDCGLLLMDYPGYGKSPGAPSEATNYDAAHGAWRWLTATAGVAPERVVIFAKSLGGGVSCELAQGKPLLSLVLESTFTSIPAVVRRLIPFLPAGGAMKSELYDSLVKLPAIRCPVLVVHGTRDELIPVEEGQALFAKANEPKRLYLVEGATHNDVAWTAGPAYGATIRAWLDECEKR
jgi:pimeloyl-ACP methyl ester carboxylesterase